MKATIKLLLPALLVFGFALPTTSIAADISMSELLSKVRAGRAADAEVNRQREAAFSADAAQQEALIRQAQSQVAQMEAESSRLEAEFNQNESAVTAKKQQRDERLGSLKELFGHLTGAAGDMRTRFRNSITTSQFNKSFTDENGVEQLPRIDFLTALIKKMNDDTDLPSMEEIERLWFEMHQELTASGQVTKYDTAIGTGDQQVVRVGLFNLLTDGQYVGYDNGISSVLARQPGKVPNPSDIQGASVGQIVPVGIDPTGPKGGGFLKALINTPTFMERWNSGGLVGYMITALGVVGVLLAIWRWLAISGISGRVKRQLKTKTISDKNPLGRILKVAADNPGSDNESLELKLGEQIIKERPSLMRGINLLKVIAMVAPLMGLLGTVTGMIRVFSDIVIYGAGDPSVMAGGISLALVTTVLGLCVAIPMLLLHSLVNGKAKSVQHVLEEQSAGIIAERTGR